MDILQELIQFITSGTGQAIAWACTVFGFILAIFPNIRKKWKRLFPSKIAPIVEQKPEKTINVKKENLKKENQLESNNNENTDGLSIPVNQKKPLKSHYRLFEQAKREWKNLSLFEKIGIILGILGLVIGVLGIVISLLLWSIDGSSPPAEDNSEVDKPQILSVSIDGYIEILEGKSGGKVLEYFYDDLDGDSLMEMFAVIADENSEDIEYGTLWYANYDTVVELIDEEIVSSYLYSIKLDKKKFLAIMTSLGNTVGSQFLYLWTVSNGIPQEYSISPNGQKKVLYLNANKYDEIEVHVDYYDESHEYVTYYLYFDGEDFHEYGGIQISLEDLRRVPNIDGVIDQITSMENDGVIILDIFYRGNGIIDINYVRDNMLYNYLRIRLLEDGGIEYPDHGDDRGCISGAYYDRIATYPYSFPY